jgi:hypothetical protein
MPSAAAPVNTAVMCSFFLQAVSYVSRRRLDEADFDADEVDDEGEGARS